jgi:Fe-S oxidoreductase
MLDRAKRQLMHIIDVLRAEIEGGIPGVVLEPACASVFRDELTNLFPANEEAKRLRQQTYLLCSPDACSKSVMENRQLEIAEKRFVAQT